jgi:hypothetical protein
MIRSTSFEVRVTNSADLDIPASDDAIAKVAGAAELFCTRTSFVAVAPGILAKPKLRSEINAFEKLGAAVSANETKAFQIQVLCKVSPSTD